MIRNIISNGIFTELLQEAGENLVSVVFSRLQTELMKSTAEALSEILMLLAQNYPQETRLEYFYKVLWLVAFKKDIAHNSFDSNYFIFQTVLKWPSIW